MARIKIKFGGCGIKYTDENGVARHALKTPESGPFDCDEAKADELVALGMAEYVGPVWRQVADEAPAPQTEGQQAETEAEQEPTQEPVEPAQEPVEPAQEPEKRMGHLSAEDLETWDYNDLKALAADMGVKPEGKKKADYIAAIVAVEVELGPEVDPDELDDPDNELPDLCAADPE